MALKQEHCSTNFFRDGLSGTARTTAINNADHGVTHFAPVGVKAYRQPSPHETREPGICRLLARVFVDAAAQSRS